MSYLPTADIPGKGHKGVMLSKNAGRTFARLLWLNSTRSGLAGNATKGKPRSNEQIVYATSHPFLPSASVVEDRLRRSGETCSAMSGAPGCSTRCSSRVLSSASGSTPSTTEIIVPNSPSPLPADSLSVTNPPPPPRPGPGTPAWTDPSWASSLDVKRRIFCNRSLNMNSITAVGFDMDYTLVQYKSEAFETLAHDFTAEKLVSVFGYPDVVKEFKFDWRYMMRGLIIDKKRGNIIKVDRHKYVKLAYHGFQPLTREERMDAYARSELRESFDEPDYGMIDTLFSLAEAHLFMNLVQLKDANPGLLGNKTYAEIYKNVRASVDYAHRDGSLKRAVAENPEKYLHMDPGLVPMLDVLRKSGKKVFLATNSLWDYTDVTMNYLLGGKVGKANRSHDWLKHFDVVLTGCDKPGFFNTRKPLFLVDTKTGFLVNTDDGAPIASVGDEDYPTGLAWQNPSAPSPDINGDDGKVFQGGTYGDLHKMLGVRSGTEVLYVGDHIYGDILRSKKTLGWRTMLVVPELEQELLILSSCQGEQMELQKLREQRDALDDQIHRMEWSLEMDPSVQQNGASSGNVARENGASGRLSPMEGEPLGEISVDAIQSLKQQRERIRQAHREKLRKHHETFHPIWGRLLKTGYQNSRLAHQIERFACLYTSHVGNLLYYSPHKSYRGRVDCMAHEEDPALGLTWAQSGDIQQVLDF
ncbi:hypothetical protein BSKO_12171 [Bryopsis sp. KO-2023]|nr:hypothetical protein BSKO_12171 [Bryopsis sp. KO-2023]